MHRVLVTGGSGFIGSHLLDRLIEDGHSIVNVDLNRPKIAKHLGYWSECDIKDLEKLRHIFKTFSPTKVVHLAAKANLNGQSINDFPDNTIGTANIIDCVNATESVELFINTSTQYVVRPGIIPQTDKELEPYTAYGESKAEAERIVRNQCRPCWVIVRPTNVWGPRHPFFPGELWRYLRLRYYMHPGWRSITKHYCYVKNAVEQLMIILLSEDLSQTFCKVYYLSDGPIDSIKWMDGFSIALSGKKARRIPYPAWFALAKIGDLLNFFAMKFPMNSDRLFRLTVNECLPSAMLLRLPNTKIVSLQDGIMQSVEWYRSDRTKTF